jgi:hypothetical protein
MNNSNSYDSHTTQIFERKHDFFLGLILYFVIITKIILKWLIFKTLKLKFLKTIKLMNIATLCENLKKINQIKSNQIVSLVT